MGCLLWIGLTLLPERINPFAEMGRWYGKSFHISIFQYFNISIFQYFNISIFQYFHLYISKVSFSG